MPIGNLLNAASSVAGAATGAPMGPSYTDIAPNVDASLSAPFAVGRGASAMGAPGGVNSGLFIALAIVAAAIIMRR